MCRARMVSQKRQSELVTVISLLSLVKGVSLFFHRARARNIRVRMRSVTFLRDVPRHSVERVSLSLNYRAALRTLVICRAKIPSLRAHNVCAKIIRGTPLDADRRDA